MVGLCETNLPKLWIPKRDSFYVLEAIPLLGTGKVELRAVKALALEMTGGMTKPSSERSGLRLSRR